MDTEAINAAEREKTAIWQMQPGNGRKTTPGACMRGGVMLI